MKVRTKIFLGLLAICLIWGSTWAAIKIGLTEVPPFFAAAVRFIVASIILYGILVHQKIELPQEQNFRLLTLQLAFGSFCIPFALTYWAQKYIPSGLASILFAIYPFAVALFARLRLKGETLSLTKIIGITLGFIGVYTIFSGEFVVDSIFAIWGMIAVVVGAILQAYVIVSIRKYGEHYNTFALTFSSMSIGALLLLILSLLLEKDLTIIVSSKAIGSILYLATFGSIITFATYYWLVKYVHPVVLSLTSFITPIIAIIIGAILLNEDYPPALLNGVMLVLSGILISNVEEIYRILKHRTLSFFIKDNT